jgi:hypothetical protein
MRWEQSNVAIEIVVEDSDFTQNAGHSLKSDQALPLKITPAKGYLGSVHLTGRPFSTILRAEPGSCPSPSTPLDVTSLTSSKTGKMSSASTSVCLSRRSNEGVL